MRISHGKSAGLSHGLAWLLMLCTILSGLAGCYSSGKPRVKRTPGSAVTADDLVGRWKMQYVQVPVEIDFLLLDISHKDKRFAVSLIGAENHPVQPKIKTVDIKEDGHVRMEIEMGSIVSSFQGKLEGENVWGTLMMPQFQLTPAKLERTEVKSLDYHKEPDRISALADLMAAENSTDKFVSLGEFVQKRDSYRSPLLIEAYAELAYHFKSEKYTLEKVKEFIAEYRKAVDIWGPRMAPRVDLEVAKALSRQEIFPDLTKELLTKAEQEITGDYPLEWKVPLAECWVNLAEPEHALKLLKPLQELDETNPMIRSVYARAKEKQKDYDEALKAYAGLAMLPQLEASMTSRGQGAGLMLPSESAARLWKQKHGDTKGLDEYLKQAYNDQMKLFVPQRKPTARDSKGQVTLIELFTGAACEPCVPSDIACESLHKAFSPQEVVVIKYHQHAPLPDPLTNEAGLERASYYDAKSTPTMVFNGHVIQGTAGFVGQSANLISRLKMAIDEELKKTSPVELKLSATRTGDDIEIKASVTGITTTDNDPRLMLVLLENDIQFTAPNGMRVHNAIARAFAGDVVGIKLKPGEIDHTQKISLTKVKADIVAHLKQIEDQVGKEFPAKPMDLGRLQVAAIVQKQLTKGYVQAALVDVVEAKP